MGNCCSSKSLDNDENKSSNYIVHYDMAENNYNNLENGNTWKKDMLKIYSS